MDPSHAKFTCKRCPPKGDTQTMINQSEIGLEIKDTLEVGHTNTSEVIWLATTMYHSVVTSVRILWSNLPPQGETARAAIKSMPCCIRLLQSKTTPFCLLNFERKEMRPMHQIHNCKLISHMLNPHYRNVCACYNNKIFRIRKCQCYNELRSCSEK